MSTETNDKTELKSAAKSTQIAVQLQNQLTRLMEQMRKSAQARKRDGEKGRG